MVPQTQFMKSDLINGTQIFIIVIICIKYVAQTYFIRGIEENIETMGRVGDLTADTPRQ